MASLHLHMVPLLILHAAAAALAAAALASPSNSMDLAALLAFKEQLNDPLRFLASNWTAAAPFCSWAGVSCDRRQRVTGIEVSDMPLQGSIAPQLGNLSLLSTLILSNTSITGPLPNELGSLSRLRTLDLSYNTLSVQWPYPFGARCLRDLERLSIPGNNFTGSVPSWLATLPNLYLIYLSTNGFSGKTPVELSNNTGLLGLDLSENNIEGEIPSELGQLRNLEYLSIASNNITGVIPETLGNLYNLTQLDLAGNRLTGSVPGSFSKLLNLGRIWLSGNQLSGNLDFLAGLTKCRSLDTIGITDNKFTRMLQTYMGDLSTMLQYFLADNNNITGSIPSTVAKLRSLLVLSLSGNNLRGKIPVAITTMNNLQELDLSNNNLSGTIPEDISRLANLAELHLDNNRLIGSIPSSLNSLSQLQVMTLSHNSLSSNKPRSMWDLQKLIRLDLSENSLSGFVAADVGKLIAITMLNLSGNKLSGEIPISFGELDMIIYLDLSSNLFQGSIPETFGRLLSIEELDLSSNDLSGAIPKSLSNLKYIATLNLSFNRLDGHIPEGGVFSNITLKSLMGKNALCGLPRLGIAQCQNNSIHSRPKKLLIKILLPVVLALLILALFFFVLRRMKVNKQRKTPIALDTDLQNHQLISYFELVRATNNFTDENLIGKGSFGKVFKAELDDGSMIAIKVLNMEHESAFKSFDTECCALRMARHRNLLKIISTCSNLDFKALILEYMPHGSLDDWLYSNDGRQLSFLQRIGIMLEVAMAVEYLHHHHFEVILHCDLKPSNILLDEDMIAHVSDFGISTLLHGDDSSITLTSMPGTIGYMAPEFGSIGRASRASDIYSYGIVLLEVFTTKRPTDPMLLVTST